MSDNWLVPPSRETTSSVGRLICGALTASALGPIERELLARACESALLAALIAAQAGGFGDLVEAITILHGIAGNHRRDLEEGADAP
jgi:hypothetical protein